MPITSSASANGWSTKALPRSMLRPVRTHVLTPRGSARSRCCAKRRVTYCGGSASGEVRWLGNSEGINAVGCANLEPIVAETVLHQSAADFHEGMLNPHFEIGICGHVNLVVSCPS